MMSESQTSTYLCNGVDNLIEVIYISPRRFLPTCGVTKHIAKVLLHRGELVVRWHILCAQLLSPRQKSFLLGPRELHAGQIEKQVSEQRLSKCKLRALNIL